VANRFNKLDKRRAPDESCGESAMPVFQMNLFLLCLVVFVALNTLVLRLSCRLTNYVGRRFRRWAPIEIPKYRTCLVIVLGVIVITSLIGSASELFIGSWMAHFFSKRTWTVVVAFGEVLLLIKLIAWGLSDQQPAPTRLVSIASFVHVVLVSAACLVMGQILPALKS
jgi:hypothetical protein